MKSQHLNSIITNWRIRTGLSIKNRVILSFTLMILLVLISSGMGFWFTKSTEKTIDVILDGTREVECINALQISRLSIVDTIDNIILTRQTSLIEQDINGEMEELNHHLKNLQTQACRDSVGWVSRNQSYIDDLLVLGENLNSIVDDIVIVIREGRWATAQSLHHNELASWGRLFDESLDQVSNIVRENVELSTYTALRAQKRLQMFWVMTAVTASAIGSILTFLTIVSIIRPISDLVSVALAIRDGNLSVQAKAENYDEFSVLARTFNDMTTQLKSLISDLNHQVNELAQKNKDQKLLIESTVGRELRMKELKEEISELKKRLKKS